MATQRPKPLMTLTLPRYDRTAPLLDGVVTMENVRAWDIPLVKAWDGLVKGVFDAAEAPMGGFIYWMDQGEPLIGLPIFPDRIFMQQYIYVKADTDIQSLADLRGRRVCVPQYNMSSSFWHRATLKEDYGIFPHEIEWYTTRPEMFPTPRPENIKVTVCPPKKGTFIGFEPLLDGVVDCLMTEATPRMTVEQSKQVQRLHQNAAELQRDYYRRTGFHVPTHIIAVHKEALERRPDLGEVICKGFDDAMALIYRGFQNERLTTLPFMRSYVDETLELFGDMPWGDGFERNRAVMDKWMELAYDQSLTKRRWQPEELFDERSRSYEFQAKMPIGSF